MATNYHERPEHTHYSSTEKWLIALIGLTALTSLILSITAFPSVYHQ
ncbi:MAG: hypothetical protein ACE5F4_01645 [Candidatus Paceibacteria bacterium]